MGTWETDPFLGDNKITRFYDEWRDDWWYSASATLKGDLGFAELSVNGSYFDRKVNYEWDNTNYAHWRSYFYDGTIYDTDALRATIFNWQKQNRYSAEVRLTSQGDSKLQWMAGAFYEDVYDWWENGVEQPGGLTSTPAWEVANEQCFDAIGTVPGLICPLPPSDIYYYKKYHNEVKQLAFFGEMTYNLTDKWSVTGGARWFEFDRNQFDMYQVPKGLPSDSDPEANGLVSQGTDSDTTFKFATDYHFTPDVMLYFLYSEGFRLGGSNSQRAADTGEVPLEYGPDSLANYEAGLKSEWLDHRLQLNVSAFFMQWDDIQVHFSDTDRDNGGAYWIEGNINGGKAEQKGVEFNGTWYATDRLNFSWSAFLASPEFTEDTFRENDDPATADPYIAKGWTMPVSPKEKYWASVEYTFPDFLPWAGDFWTRFSYTYQGKVWDSLSAIEDFELAETDQERADALEFYLPEWKSGTFQIGFTSESGWDAALIVRNVFDDASYSYLSGSWYGEDFTGVNADGDPRWKHVRTLQRPQSVYLSFSKKW